MTKRQLVQEITKKFPQYSNKEADTIVGEVFSCITKALAKGERVELRGFAAFSVKYRAARQAHNPSTGEGVRVPAKKVPTFKASKEMQRRLNGRDQTENH